jgi:hypothetical protein
MQLELQSPVLKSGRRRMIVLLSAFSVLPSFALSQLMAQSGGNISAPRHEDVFRIEVCDGESNRPLADAEVTIVLWRREDGLQQRKELEARTDDKGLAVFPKVEFEKLAVRVEAKGYRSISRWISPGDSDRAIRIRLEKWRRVSG